MSAPLRLSQILLEEYELLFPGTPSPHILNQSVPYETVVSPRSLIDRLRKDPAQLDAGAGLLLQALSPIARGKLTSFCGSQAQVEALSEILKADVNDLLQDSSFTVAPLSNDTQLSAPTKKYIASFPDQLASSPFLKRMVLGDVFSDHFEKLPLSEVYKLFHQLPKGATALCLSGGGIRSATFNLGLIQTLARYGFLTHFDYLSTVSGGGYIGSWLSAWVWHESGNVQSVAALLSERTWHTRRRQEDPTTVEHQQIAHLRRYRNYLVPNWSLASLDSWTLVATYLRNLFLNWSVLIPALLALLALPRIAVALIHYLGTIQNPALPWWLLGLGSLAAIITIASITYHLKPTAGQAVDDKRIFYRCFLPLFCAAALLAAFWVIPNCTSMLGFILYAVLVHVLGVSGGLLCRFLRAGAPRASPRLSIITLSVIIFAIIGASAASGFATWLIATNEFSNPRDVAFAYATLSVPLLLSLFLLGGDVLVGIISRWTTDEHREWKARLNALVLRAALAWIGGCVIVLYAPYWMAQFPTLLSSFGGLSGLLALLLGFSSKAGPTDGDSAHGNAQKPFVRIGLNVAAPIGVGSILVLLSWVTGLLFLKGSQLAFLRTNIERDMESYNLTYHMATSLHHFDIVEGTSGEMLVCFLIGCVAISVFMSCLVDINKFSLHSLYRDRLIRTFLGASNTDRRPDGFTGFDLKDNLEMRQLRHAGHKLFHVVNIALNLLRTKDRAWQNRKAASFAITPLHCGSLWPEIGYRRSEEYGRNNARRQSITLGTAMAISGAAVSPNMGYHSSAAVTVLMTLFNVRLGWWLGNPASQNEWGLKWFLGEVAEPSWQRSAPIFSLAWWAKEAFSHTREDNAYLYLSDGGHFENLGLYEMVLRRCRYIVVSDSGCDPNYALEDLGNAIRKIRVDLGIEIELNLEMLKPEKNLRYSRWHHAIGTIRYDKADQHAPLGTLLYIKASLTGDEPTDVEEYATAHSGFPHEKTGDQFFDESQFESYRKLGEHIGREVFKPAREERAGLDQVFHRLKAHWITFPPGIRDSFLKTTEAFVRLETKLRKDPRLTHLDREIYPELETILGIAPSLDQGPGNARATLHFCTQAIQMMEDVFVALELDKYYAHPLNSGWMNFFRRLGNAPTLRKLWPSLRSTYSRAFIEFCEPQLNLGAGIAPEWRTTTLSDSLRERLVREFEREWPIPDRRGAFNSLLANAAGLGIVSAHPPSLAEGREDVWGVAGAYPDPTIANTYQANVWVRGAYRGVGIGTGLLKRLMQALTTMIETPFTVQIVLPALSPNKPGYEMEKAGWLEFYSRQGFAVIEDTAERYVLSRAIVETTT